jgi:hypothetical protein
LKHLHDDDLVLYHYGEIRTAPAEGHLRICRGCRERLSAMPFDPAVLKPPPADFTRPIARPEPSPEAPPRRPGLLRRLLLRLTRRPA